MRYLTWIACIFAVVAWGCATAGDTRRTALTVPPETAPYPLPERGQLPETLPEIDEQSTLSDYLAFAALNNPGLEAAFNRWKAALERIPQVTALPDPRFTYGYYIQAVETRVGPQRQRFALTQLFPWFGKLALRGDQAMEAANAEKERFEAAKLRLFFRVKDAYYEYNYVARATAVTEATLQLVRRLEEVVRTRYASGMAAYADVVRVQVELGKIEDNLRALREFRGPVAAKLNAALGAEPGKPLPWPLHVVEEEVRFSDEQLLCWLKESNPSLRALDFMAAGERVAIDLARKSYFPDITLGLEVIDTGDAIVPSTPDSGKDPVIASISINLPIWRQKYRAEENEARARFTAACKERKDRENTLGADLKMALYNFRDAERKIDLYRNALIPKAEQAVAVSMRGFETGGQSFLDVIDSERSLLEFQLVYERSLANRAQRLAELEMLVGKEVPRVVQGPSETTRDGRGIELNEESAQ